MQPILSKHAATNPPSALNKWDRIWALLLPTVPVVSEKSKVTLLSLPMSRAPKSPFSNSKPWHRRGKTVASGFLQQDSTWAQCTLSLSIVHRGNEEVNLGSESRGAILLLAALSATFLTNPAVSDDLVCYSVSFFPTRPNPDPVPSSPVNPVWSQTQTWRCLISSWIQNKPSTLRQKQS